MVRSFNLLRNVGKFDSVDAGAHLPFSRLTVIYAENARGKTTLAAILRSLASARPELVAERARLGATHPPHIVIDIDDGPPAVFQDGTWSRTARDIVIFDDTFVADNVYSGIEVSATQRQNLHELIVGEQGIALARELKAEVDRVEVHIRELRDRENAIPVQVRGGLTVGAFCALANMDNLPRVIEDAERRLAAAREAGKIAEMPTFQTLSLPRIDIERLSALLAEGLEDLDVTALARVHDHLGGLGREGETWVAEGMHLVERASKEGHADCPFCAQNLEGSPLLDHYRAYFGEAYDGLKRKITEAIREFQVAQSGDVRAAFERSIRETVERQAFWRAFAEVPIVEIDTAAIARTWTVAIEQVKNLLEAKRAAPLEAMSVPADVRQSIAEHNSQCDRTIEISGQLASVNPELAVVKEQARDANVATLETDLIHLRAVEARHSPAVAPLCDAYLAEKAAKADTEQRRNDARIALDYHRQAAFPAYGVAINDFLQRFNASFRLGPVDPVNNRGGSAANYSLLIDGNAVPLSANP